MARIIAVANQKGGVGKTTTAINLAAGLARKGFGVMLVDCDPQSNATSGLGVRLEPREPSLYTFLMGDGPAPTRYPLPTLPLKLLPASNRLAAAELELLSQDDPESLLSRRLKSQTAGLSHVIIDCPPSLGLLTVNSLIAADSVLIPLQCEYYALEGLTLLLETIRKVKMRWNPDLAIEGILLTMFDRRNNLSHQVVTEVREHFDFRVFNTMIPRNVRLGESPSHGLPVMVYDPTCAGAVAYEALTDEVIAGGNGVHA